jgi:hypothetical protein
MRATLAARMSYLARLWNEKDAPKASEKGYEQIDK